MHPKYPRIFSTIRLGPVEIRNRFYSSPHLCPLATHAGAPSDDYIAYYMARVKGGCGLVILSLAAHDRSRYLGPSPYLKETIPEWRKLTNLVHAEYGKIFGQLWYWWGAAGNWSPLGIPAPAFTPSVSQYSLFERRDATREMSKREIHGMLAAYRQSAANLREAGFDGVMLHASHGCLVEQFLSPYYNRRTDEYGGSRENRMRLLMELLLAIREEAGPQMAVGIRLNCNELICGGYDAEDARQILKTVADSGLIDYVDLDVAVEPEQFYLGMPSVFVPPHVYRPHVEAVRGAAGRIPVLSVLGRVTSIADAEAALESGVCDMAGAARALIAEPELVRNAFEGKEDRSRKCIACNWCQFAMADGAQSCTINPASYRERYWGSDTFTPAPRRVKVVVVGAGPAGLEAARVSALRGHEVVLLEGRPRTGGAFTLWASLPGREFYQEAVHWWESEVRRLGVDIRLGREATGSSVLDECPEAVIIATGARYSVGGHSNQRDLAIPGYEQEFVYRPEDILLRNIRPSGNVVVLDGEGLHTGVGIAELLAGAGANVEYLTPHFSPVSPRVIATSDVRFIMKRLRTARVKVTPSTYIKRIGDHDVTAYDVHSEEERVIGPLDAIVLSTGRVSVNGLEKELDGKVSQLFTVGDALAARMWAAASYEGQKFARYIGERQAPTCVADVYFGGSNLNP